MRDLILITNKQLTTDMVLPEIEKTLRINVATEEQIYCGKTPRTANIFLPSKSSDDPASINCDGTRIYEKDGWLTTVEYRIDNTIKKVVGAILEIDPCLIVLDEDDNLVKGIDFVKTI